MIESLEAYVSSLGNNKEVLNWVQTTGRKALKTQKTTESELEHIIDFLVSDKAPSRLRKMSFKDAKRKAQEWSEANQKRGRDLVDGPSDLEILHDFGDGRKIVKLLTKKSFEREGFLMSHCLGGYSVASDVAIYSYRDKDNMPHATFEVSRDGEEIIQIKGKGNGAIHPKYIDPILEFLKAIGKEIRVSEMKYLGYYHIHESHVEFLKSRGLEKQMVEINGNWYAF